MSKDDYTKITSAIHFIKSTAHRQPGLEEIAAHIGLSPWHFQRLFQRWAGVSPKRFLQYLTCSEAKGRIAETGSLLEASWDVGLSGSGRLHDLFVTVEAVTPGEFKSGGAGLVIHWGVHPSPFGDCLVGVTSRGICALRFLERGASRAVDLLHQEWPAAELRNDQELTAPRVQQAFSLLDDRPGQPLPLLLKGTNLQLQVWQALLKIPTASTTTYGQIAKAIGKPTAARAVGNAIGKNPIAWLIPCHRVLRSDGGLGGYRWGEDRKLAILVREWAQAD